MKKLEKDLLLMDLDNANIQFELKIKKLDTIISYYLDDTDTNTVITEEKIKEDITEPTENSNEDENTVDIDDTILENNTSTDENISDDLPHHDKIDNLPSDIKTLYRKIMIKTHPDKSKVQNEEYEYYYKMAVKAKDDNDKPTLIYIAYKLNIEDIYNMDEEHFGSIKKRIKEVEIKTNTLNNNPFWIWYHTDSKHLRNVMIDQITKIRYKK